MRRASTALIDHRGAPLDQFLDAGAGGVPVIDRYIDLFAIGGLWAITNQDYGPAIEVARQLQASTGQAIVLRARRDPYWIKTGAVQSSSYAFAWAAGDLPLLVGDGPGHSVVKIAPGCDLGGINLNRGAPNVCIAGITFDGNCYEQTAAGGVPGAEGGTPGAPPGVHGLRVENADDLRIIDCEFLHTCDYGIGFENNVSNVGKYRRVWLTRVKVTDSWNDGIDFKDDQFANDAVKITDCVIELPNRQRDPNNAGIDCRGLGFTVSGLHVKLDPLQPVTGALRFRENFAANPPASANQGAFYSVATNVVVDMNGATSGYGLYIAANHTAMRGFDVRGASRVSGNAIGVKTSSQATGGTFEGGKIQGGMTGVALSGPDSLVSNVTVRDAGQDSYAVNTGATNSRLLDIDSFNAGRYGIQQDAGAEGLRQRRRKFLNSAQRDANNVSVINDWGGHPPRRAVATLNGGPALNANPLKLYDEGCIHDVTVANGTPGSVQLPAGAPDDARYMIRKADAGGQLLQVSDGTAYLAQTAVQNTMMTFTKVAGVWVKDGA